MTYSALTNQVRLSNQSSSRQGAKIDTFLIHHQAGTNDDAVLNAMVSGSRQVSANYTISNEGRITSVVPEELRAWTSGSTSDGGKGAAWDRRAITVEIENQSAGGSWPISGAAKTAAANLLNDLRARYGALTLLGHRDLFQRYGASYATFCPGPNTVAEILAIAGGGSAAVDSASEASTAFNGYNVKKIQTLVTRAGFATAVDGIYGPDTRAKVTAYQKAKKLLVDGIVGQQTWASLNSTPAPAKASNKLAVDGVWGFATTVAEQIALGVTADGIRGPNTIMAEQRKTGARVDGLDGPNTRKSLQRYLKVKRDGIIGPNTVRALQSRLNAGTF
jgi:peptidoglycan hydrolase-like protein with peptidoglycan-binding domain